MSAMGIRLKMFLIVFLLNRSVFAGEYRTFFEGIRALGMGGAQIAVVNDETALLANPAALGKLRNFYGTIIDPELDFSGNFLTLYQAKPFSGFFDPNDIKQTVLASPGKHYHAGAKFFPSFVAKNFGIGIFSHYLLDMEADSSTIMRHLYYRNDLAFVLGYNIRFFDGRIKLGFNAKLISRQEVDQTNIDTATVTDLSVAALGSEGAGLGTDVALILTAPWKYLPTLSVVARDLGNTKYDQMRNVRPLGNANAAPTATAQDVDIAMALFPIHNKYVRSTWTIEYKGYLTAQNDPDSSKRMHFGWEMNLGDLFFLRAGYNQRYWTAGLELATEKFQFQFASYGEEVGTATRNEEDRRVMAKFVFRF